MQNVVPFCTVLQKHYANSFQGFLVAGPFLAITLYYWRHCPGYHKRLPSLVNAGYEEIAVLFEPIKKSVEITSMYNNEQLLDDVIVKVLV